MTGSLTSLENDLAGARLAVDAARRALDRCRERHAAAEAKLAAASVNTPGNVLAEAWGISLTMAQLDEDLAADVTTAEDALTAAEAALAAARQRVGELEAAAKVPTEIAEAQEALAALAGAR